MTSRPGIRARLRRLGLYPQLSERNAPVSRLSNLSWWPVSRGCDDGPISRTGLSVHAMSEAWRERFLAEMQAAAPVPLVAERRWGYFSENRPRELAHLNSANEYRAITPGLLAALRAFLDERKGEIDAALGHSWRVASVRQFYLRPGGTPGGRHYDGWPLAIRKLFILPNGATPRTGSTWFRLRDGSELVVDEPRPIWMLFENSQILHALVPGEVPRPTIELNLVPARRTSTEPLNAGMNCWYPFYPWVP
jgi:hypothetical protein